MVRHSLGALVALSALAGVEAAHGAIVSTSGGITQIAPPPSCVSTALTPGFFFSAWNEQTNVSGAFPVEMTVNPSTSGSLTPGVLAGPVNSHFLHLETSAGTLVSGSIVFDAPILGVALRDSSLDVSDLSAGAVLTLYPTGNVFRGLGPPLGGATVVSINPSLFNPARLDITVFTTPITGGLVLEQLRVFTAVVPAPGASGLAAAVGLTGLRRRRATRGA